MKKIRFSLVLFLMATMAGACLSRSPENDARPVLAVVSGAPIYVDEYQARLKRMQFATGDGLPSVAGERAQREALLQDLIERHLLLREAERHNVVVGMDEVEAVYQRIRSGWLDDSADGDCPECSFTRSLEASGLTVNDLKLDVRNDLLIRKYYRDHVFSRVAVTDEEIMEYIHANPQRLVQPEEVRAQQIVVKTEEQAEMILQEIRHGLRFEEAAMKYSLSPSGKTGGDLGYFSRGNMPEVFDEVCFSLRPGSVSKVVASDYGYHLFKVIDQRPEREIPLSIVREAVEQELRRKKEHAAQLAKLEELKQLADITIQEGVFAQIH